jgi:nucleoid-associated protein YgaU
MASLSPQAKLRDEAPRPIGVEPRSPAVVRRMPSIEAAGDAPPSNSIADWSSAVQADFTSDRESAPAIQASFSPPPIGAERVSAVSPPPWPAAGDESGPRKHIIVDGDSLARLAERYLQDSRRGHEIFELNRELLSSPDLLPIGAELTIPDRLRNNDFGRQAEGTLPALNAASNGLSPIRPISTTTGVSPRAQLAPPRSVD